MVLVERMKKTKQLLLGLLLMGILCLFFLNYEKLATYAFVEEVEIREYEGEDLSSIDDFRENSISGPQYVDSENYSLVIMGLVENELEFSYNEILDGFESHKKVVTLHCVEGWSVKLLWEGVLLEDIFNLANVSSEASIVIFHAYDGYTTSLPLDYILDNRIILAYKMNNLTLPPERGFPFELVAESKYGYKWIKWITKIELSSNTDYRGYWETRGYSDDAEITTRSRPAPTSDFGNLPMFTPKPAPKPIPIPDPTNTITTPNPSIEPTYTPSPSPSLSPSEEIGLPLEPATITLVVIAAVVILVVLRQRK